MKIVRGNEIYIGLGDEEGVVLLGGLMRVAVLLFGLFFIWTVQVAAQPITLLSSGPFSGASGARLYVVAKPVDEGAVLDGASLFAGRAETGLFGDRPAHEPAYADAPLTGLQGSDVEIVRQIIGYAESRRDGYDAVQHGARIKPPLRPTQMTVAQIYHWIDQTPGQPHAIGRYQFIPPTLKSVMGRVGANPEQLFTPALQDQLADVLLAEAGLHEVRAGRIGRHQFMNNLAKIWAGLPTTSGKSHYDGYAGNKASMTWASFETQMARAFPG